MVGDANTVSKAAAKKRRDYALRYVTQRRIKEFEDMIAELQATDTALDGRICDLESSFNDLADIKKAVFKALKYIKLIVPSIVTAGITAGVINGTIGKFFLALFGAG